MRKLCGSLILLCTTIMPAFSETSPAYTLECLAEMSACQLEQIFRQASPGQTPSGFVRGRSVFCESEFLPGPRQKAANFFWKGKHFRDDNTLINQFPGFRMIRAEVYPGESWLDGQPAQILDYRKTSHVWSDVRDEMRQVGPGLYVGAMFLQRCPQPKLKLFFIVEAECR